jgi:centromeric protein E
MWVEHTTLQVNDLLNPDPKAQVKIQHDPKAGTILSGVKEQVVMNPAQVVALLQGGEAYRHVSSTEMNDKSSRAHTLFKLIVESKAINSGSGSYYEVSIYVQFSCLINVHFELGRHVRVSTLNLVDLAGSENAKMTNSTGERAREAKFINQSLLTLSTIIHKLSEESVRGGGAGKRKGPMHMPYRDSKLTR